MQRKETERTNFRVACPTSRYCCSVAVVTKKKDIRDIRKRQNIRDGDRDRQTERAERERVSKRERGG